MQEDIPNATESKRPEDSAPAAPSADTDPAADSSSAAGSSPDPNVPASASPSAPAPASPEPFEPHPDEEAIKESIVGVLRTIFDPEIPINIYEIGLIYEIKVDVEGKAFIKMTLTSPMCPVAGTLPPEVEQKVSGALGVREAKVELVWDPPWGPERMSEAARLQLNL